MMISARWAERSNKRENIEEQALEHNPKEDDDEDDDDDDDAPRELPYQQQRIAK
jgi:hypothetical protein